MRLPSALLGLFFASALLAAPVAGEPPSTSPGAASGFLIRRGTNISHWLSQSKRRGEERRNWFTEKDVAFLASIGLDHLRIPIDEEQMWKEDGTPDEEAFSLLQNGLDWCAAHRLRAIVDLHILRSHHFNAAEKPLWTQESARERFLDCWRELSRRLSSRSVEMVAYEIMNEPVADDPEDWNRLLARAVSVLRALEPERVLVIGSNRWQSVTTFDKLKVSEDDLRIILSFHFYEPFALTHYQAGWNTAGKYRGPVRYPGVVVADEDMKGLPKELQDALRGSNRHFDRAVLEEMLQKPLALSRSTGLPLYCGEWGALPTSPRGDRLNWYRDMRTILEKHGIAWATWDYKGGFGLLDRQGEPDEELIELLVR